MDDLDEILKAQRSWLRGRAGRVASSLGRPWEAEDIVQEVLVEYFTHRDRWLEQAPIKSRAIQIRSLLGLCLKRVRSRRFQKDWQLVSLPPGEGGEAGPFLGDPGAGGEEELAASIDDRRRRDRLLVLIHERLRPPRRLFLLALAFPERVERGLLEQAIAHRAGGAVALKREVAEAWSLFVRHRDASSLQSHTEWKRTVAEIFQLDGPIGSHSKAELSRAINYLDQQYSRAIKDLSRLMEGERT